MLLLSMIYVIKYIHSYMLLLRPILLCTAPPLHVCSTMYSTGGLQAIKYFGGPNRWEIINFILLGKHHSLLFLSTTPSCPSRTLGGLFEITQPPSRALDLPRVLLLELQRYKDTIRCAALGAEVPGHCQEQPTQNLIFRRKSTFLHTNP